MKNILSDYPDIISVALIPMIIAIFALGFPLLIQTISRIDDKYHSTKLIKTFINETITKWFLGTLLSSIASYILWFFQIPPLVDWGWLIDKSALILITINTVALIITTFLLVKLTYIYYVPEILLGHLVNKHEKVKKADKERLELQAISKMLNYSILTIDEPLAEKLWEFYFSEFIQFRKGKENQQIIYPKGYYDTFLDRKSTRLNSSH